jgi:MFS family permease
MLTLFAAQALASAAFVANNTVNPILGKELSGEPRLSGLPLTLILIGAAYSAFIAGRVVPSLGWRRGLSIGFVAGTVGMAISSAAIAVHSFALFLGGLALVGAARGFLDLSRYAAADANPPANRARAISGVVWAGTVGAIAGPALVEPLGNVVAGLGIDPLAGPQVGGVALFIISGLLIWSSLRPDPSELARQFTPAAPTPTPEATPRPATSAAPGRTVMEVLRQPLVQVAIAAMVIGQAVMVLVMSQTSLHMYNHQHTLGEASFVVMVHVLGMYGLSPLTGLIADRIGRLRTIMLGGGLLIAGAALAPISLDILPITVALFLIGYGWNLCYIGGSSLLSECVAAEERGKVQGTSDLIVNLTSATSSLTSGVILAALGYGALCLIGGGLAVVPILLSGWRSLQTPPPALLGNLRDHR